MSRYIGDYRRSGTRAIDDINNALLLRSDLQRAFDQVKFVFVPKLGGVEKDDSSVSLVTHLLVKSSELGKLYHNTELYSIIGVAPEFLLTRFALAIFPYLEVFLHAGVSRQLLVSSNQSRLFPPNECEAFTRKAASDDHSEGLNKRTRADTIPEDQYDLGEACRSSERSHFEQEHSLCEPPHHAKRLRVSPPQSHRSAPNHSLVDSDLSSSQIPVGQIDSFETVSTSLLGTTPMQMLSIPLPSNPKLLRLRAEGEAEEESDEEQRRISALLRRDLDSERARSDPDGKWRKEQEWADSIMDNGGALDREDFARYFRSQGFEILEDE